MSSLAIATTERLAEVTTDYDKMCTAFSDYKADPTDANMLVLADNMALSLIEKATPDGYMTEADYPTILAATEISIVTIAAPDPARSSIGFTYRVDGGAELEGSLTEMYGCVFSL